jgi:hypothetical protein
MGYTKKLIENLEQIENEFKKILPIYKPKQFHPESSKPKEYGKYLVVRKDGKIHFEVWNGTGWAYNQNSITHFYLPKVK